MADTVSTYAMVVSSGLTTAIAVDSPVLSLRAAAAPYTTIVTALRVTALTATGFASAFNLPLEVMIARGFTASDSGGTAATLTGNEGKTRTSDPTSHLVDLRVPTTAALTAGTRTLDTNPVLLVSFAVGTAANVLAANGSTIATAGDQPPIVLAPNEGLIIKTGIVYPATGTLQFRFQLVWSEVAGPIPAGFPAATRYGLAA